MLKTVFQAWPRAFFEARIASRGSFRYKKCFMPRCSLPEQLLKKEHCFPQGV